jgi:hypothetical protein
MPQLSFHVSDLQQKTKSATIHELVHANRVLDWAQQWVNRDKVKLRFLPLKGDVNVNLVYTEQQDSRYQRQQARMQKLGLAAIHDASWGGQPDMGSQMGYAIMLGSTQLYDGPTVTHLLEWRSAKIDRKVASTLAAEANSASQAYDRGTYARVLLYEFERGRDKHWKDMCKDIPFCLGTDCRSLYDNTIKPASTTKEKRVALDLLDVREGIESSGDQIRWLPTDHMLMDSLTKAMHPAL